MRSSWSGGSENKTEDQPVMKQERIARCRGGLLFCTNRRERYWNERVTTPVNRIPGIILLVRKWNGNTPVLESHFL